MTHDVEPLFVGDDTGQKLAVGLKGGNDVAWLAERVTVGGAELGPIVFGAHDDRRDLERDYDGKIGRDVLARFRLIVDWHHSTMWLTPRADDPGHSARERVARWGVARFQGCAETACVSAAIERENPQLSGVLPKTYQQFNARLLKELLKTFSSIPMDLQGDAFGKIYEYFLGEFAMSEGQGGGDEGVGASQHGRNYGEARRRRPGRKSSAKGLARRRSRAKQPP